MNEPLQIAVTAWMSGTGGLAGELGRQGEIAEALGAHSFWLPENHFGDAHAIPSPLMLLAAVAARTTSIRLGSTSYLLPIRHPLAAAEEVAVLDRLSGGRVILGVGRGTQEAMFRAFDVDPKDKRKLFKSNLESMIAAWQGQPVVTLDSGEPVILSPLPVQKPHPPVWIAAFGPLAIRQAGGLGLPYLASPIETIGRLKDNYLSHGAHAQEAGHPPITTVPVMRTVFVSNDAGKCEKVSEALATAIPHAMREDGASVEDWAIVGDAPYVRERLAEYIETIGITHLIARGRVPGLDNEEHVESLEALMKIASDL